jgi:hypothetical protein
MYIFLLRKRNISENKKRFEVRTNIGTFAWPCGTVTNLEVMEGRIKSVKLPGSQGRSTIPVNHSGSKSTRLRLLKLS